MTQRLCTVLVLLACGACAGTPVSDKSAQARLQQIEQLLLDARVLRVDYEIEARGAVTAELTGDLVLQQPGLAALRAQGDFAGQAVMPLLVADGTTMRGGTSEYFTRPVPAELHGGLLLGMTRMGVLHNLAMLSQDTPPDATDGSVRDWVTASRFASIGEPRTISGITVHGISFALAVGGRQAGEAVLWYRPDTGLPVAREQLVQFDTGDMRVVERYSIETGGIIGPCRFDTDAIPPG